MVFSRLWCDFTTGDINEVVHTCPLFGDSIFATPPGQPLQAPRAQVKILPPPFHYYDFHACRNGRPTFAPDNQGNGETYGSWQVQWQAVKSALWTVVANVSTFAGGRDVLGVYGDSAGGHLGWMMTNTLDDAFRANCPVSPLASEPHFKTVSDWSILSIMTPRGNAEWNCPTAQFRTPEVTSLFGGSCTVSAGAAGSAFSALHRPEPLQWITNENLTTLQNVE
jgi:hypothetical protein